MKIIFLIVDQWPGVFVPLRALAIVRIKIAYYWDRMKSKLGFGDLDLIFKVILRLETAKLKHKRCCLHIS